VSQSIISAWESGHNHASSRYFEKLAQTLKVEIVDLLDEASANIYHQHGASGPNFVNGNGNTIITENQKLIEELLCTQRKLIASLEATNAAKDKTIEALREEVERLRR
jgi:transcriptional regulator with XRE-family HTH domain